MTPEEYLVWFPRDELMRHPPLDPELLKLLRSRVTAPDHPPLVSYCSTPSGIRESWVLSLYRPVVALAPAELGSSELRGSARSIPGFHLRDALALIDARQPGLMKKFGGHAMAAGLSLDISQVDRFTLAFDEVARELIAEELLNAVLYTDGPLPAGCLTTTFVDQLNACGPWGQGFPQPVFDNVFNVVDWRILKEKHLKVTLEDPRDHSWIDGIFFNSGNLTELASRLRVVYELDLNVWNDRRDAQLLIRHIEPELSP
jgi:single-stranded-DNA-specific exonuclease